MAPTLRARLTLILVLVNAAVLGALALWVGSGEAQRQAVGDQRFRELLSVVRDRFQQRFAPEWRGDLAEILSWPLWGEYEDAVVLDVRVLPLQGGLAPIGAFLNPNGSRRRPPDLPLPDVVRAIAETTATGSPEPAAVAGGLALPLQTYDRRIWGGVWVRPEAVPAGVPYAVQILAAAAVATLLGAGLLYLLIRRAVLAPVEHLAAAAREFGGGGTPALPERVHSPELEELVGAFRAMMGRIQGFHGELRREVEAATARAAEAERRAARQERLAAMGTLAAGLAHEINSPLSGALQGLETLRLEAVSERARRHGELTREALERIGFLVRRLLQLAPHQVEAGACAVQDVARDVPVFLESRLRRHRLLLELPEQPLRVNGAPGDLFPVLLNLVQNALDALDGQGGRAGTIWLRASPRPGGGARIAVADDGPGADPGLLPHLFEPFVTGKGPGQGTGLGLALAHATVRQLGGEMAARNAEGTGLEVEILLPGPGRGEAPGSS